MSIEQRETLDAILRQSAFPPGSDVNEQRRLLRELLSAQPLPAEVTVSAGALGDVATAEITVDGLEPRHVVLYFHGGVYVMGDAFLAATSRSRSTSPLGCPTSSRPIIRSLTKRSRHWREPGSSCPRTSHLRYPSALERVDE